MTEERSFLSGLMKEAVEKAKSVITDIEITAIDLAHRNFAAEAVRDADALDSGDHWEKDTFTSRPAIITYDFSEQSGEYVMHKRPFDVRTYVPLQATIHYGPLSPQLRAEFIAATKEMERIATVRFVPFSGGIKPNIEGVNPDKPMLSIRAADIGQMSEAGNAYYPYMGENGSSVIQFDPTQVDAKGPGSVAFGAMLHELGHAVGLKHP